MSYHSNDSDLAADLAKHLSKSGYNVWQPQQQILPGDNWARKISDALESSEAMIVLVSPESMQSDWVRNEINYALGSSKYAGRLIPVLVRPTKEMPWYLNRLEQIPAGKNLSRMRRQVIEALQKPWSHNRLESVSAGDVNDDRGDRKKSG